MIFLNYYVIIHFQSLNLLHETYKILKISIFIFFIYYVVFIINEHKLNNQFLNYK